MRRPIYIVEEIGAVVEATQAALIASGGIWTTTPINYMYGHYLEIEQRLIELTNSPEYAATKFPLVVLLTDIPIAKTINGMYGQATLHIIIANYTEAHYTAEQRLEINFKPVLYPIRDNLLYKLSRHRQFTYPGEISYTSTDRYFWGRGNRSVFNDRVDAIELTELRVNIKNYLCLPSADAVAQS